MILSLNIEVFVLTDSFRQAVNLAREDRALARSKVTVHDGGILGAIEHYAHTETPALLVVEEDTDDETMMTHLGQLANVCSPNTRVVVAGTLNDISLYRQLIGQGVSEYMVTPVSGRELVDAIERIFAKPGAAPKGRLITCRGARGGAGSSMVAANVAWSLAEMFEEGVALIDVDLLFGTAALSFNLGVKQGTLDAIAQPDRLDEAVLERYFQDVGDHLSVLAAPAQLQGMPQITIESLDKLVDMVRHMFAFVVLDIPHGWSAWMPPILVGSDEVIVTATPDLAGIRDAKTLIEAISPKREGGAPVRLAVNRRGAYADGELTAKDIEETLGMGPTVEVASDPALFLRALNNGQPIAQVGKGDKVAQVLRDLAATVAGRKPPAGTTKSSLLGGLDFKGLFKKAK